MHVYIGLSFEYIYCPPRHTNSCTSSDCFVAKYCHIKRHIVKNLNSQVVRMLTSVAYGVISKMRKFTLYHIICNQNILYIFALILYQFGKF